MQFFQAALQGTAGKSGTAKERVDSAAAIADACMDFLPKHKAAVDCAKDATDDEHPKGVFEAVFSGLGSVWGKSFLSALQTTSGSGSDPAAPVKAADELANQAAKMSLSDEPNPDRLWNLYEHCAKSGGS